MSGFGFGTLQGNSLVTLNAVATTINSWSDTAISITIPSGATSGYLVVSVAPSMNDSNPVEFTVTSQPLPASWLDSDVGSVGTSGTATYSNGTFTVVGSGQGILSTTADAFHMAFQALNGDAPTKSSR